MEIDLCVPPLREAIAQRREGELHPVFLYCSKGDFGSSARLVLDTARGTSDEVIAAPLPPASPNESVKRIITTARLVQEFNAE